MNFILLNTFVVGRVDCKNIHSMDNNVKMSSLYITLLSWI
jgi:hypothetical protein